MTPCQEIDALLALRAAGDLPPEDGARLDEHLIRCDGCRASLRAYEDVLDLARLPADDARPGDVAVATLSAYRRARRRRVTGLTLGAGFAAAALAAGVVLTPALLTLRSLPSQRRPAAAQTAVDDRATAAAPADQVADDLTAEDIALAAFDEAEAP